MSDINLLENQLSADSSIHLRKYSRKVIYGLLAILAGSLVLAGVFFALNRTADEGMAESARTLEDKKAEFAAAADSKRDDLAIGQSRMFHFGELLKGHAYWTNILEPLAGAVIPGINISEISAMEQGTLVIVAQANDLTLVADFTDRLNKLPGVSQVVLNSSSLTTSSLPGTATRYTFSLTLTLSPEVLQYHKSAQSNE